MKGIYRAISILLFVLPGQYAFSQQDVDTIPHSRTVSAIPQLQAGKFHEWLWGKGYRAEWYSPVTFPVVMLDTLKGGLTPYKEGGGNESKSLRLKTKEDKEYVIRSIVKSREKAIPEEYRGTFIEDIVNDELSMSHPYGAVAVPIMAKHAGIYHTTPQLFFVPSQPALGNYDSVYKNKIYLFEQKPAGNWSDANNLGNFSDFIDTDSLLELMIEYNDVIVDQRAFAKARLFDMF